MGRAGRSSGGRSSGRSGGFSSGGRSGGFSGGGRSGRGSASRQTRNSYPHHSPGYQPGYRRYRSGGSYGNAAITSPFSATTAVILIVVVVIALAFSAVAGNLGTGNNIPASTAHREALPAGMAQQTDYYTDELGWITNRSELTAGLKHFYQKTGIQPYLYIVDNINGNYSPTIEQLSALPAPLTTSYSQMKPISCLFSKKQMVHITVDTILVTQRKVCWMMKQSAFFPDILAGITPRILMMNNFSVTYFVIQLTGLWRLPVRLCHLLSAALCCYYWLLCYFPGGNVPKHNATVKQNSWKKSCARRWKALMTQMRKNVQNDIRAKTNFYIGGHKNGYSFPV